MSTFKIAVIQGDGIGHEVVPEGLRVLEAAGKKFGLSYEMTHFDWSCEGYAKTGRMMPEDGLEQLKKFDASSSAPSAIPACRTTSRSGGC